MAQQDSRDRLSSTLPNAPFVYPTKPKVTSSTPIYTSLVESKEWSEARDLPALGAELDRPLRDGLAATKSVVLLYVLAIEANLQHFFDLSLVYYINLALHYIWQPPIVILPHIPFTQATPRNGSIPESKSYTPDYTVFKGYIGQDPILLADYDASLIVSNIKLYSKAAAQNQVNHTDVLSWSDLEFIVNYSDRIIELSNVVAKAKSELSSPMQGILPKGEPAPSKRRYIGSTTGSTLSPSNRHQNKRNVAAAETVNIDA
ncbi:hypothetical protein EV127DRAFT_487073 [Xylaria flabelliformis]|nr:hypothetical protein EV127DRAFT_487073 [Xylaria flabelliformis]